MIDLQDIITTKRELLSRATCSLSPINYSAGMAEDQNERYLQYPAEQNPDLRLTSDTMKLVLEDFMAQMKDCLLYTSLIVFLGIYVYILLWGIQIC